MSGLLCRMDWTVSFTSSFNVFVVQSNTFQLCFTKIRALLDWSLNPLSVQRHLPGILISTPFFKCSHVRMIFQCKCVILKNLFFGPSNIWQRLAVLLIFLPSFQNSFTTTILVAAGFPQHTMSIEAHGLPHRWSMSGTVGWFLFGGITRN